MITNLDRIEPGNVSKIKQFFKKNVYLLNLWLPAPWGATPVNRVATDWQMAKAKAKT